MCSTPRARYSRALIPSLLVMGVLLIFASGCANNDAVMTAVPPRDATLPGGPGDIDGAPAHIAGTSGEVVITAHQRGYLDALSAAGVHRSSDLTALSIASCVCQARAAGQSDQDVWDLVFPMVRGDVADLSPGVPKTTVQSQAVSATRDYIRIASERFC
ncbi:DUF732 domain-containing protein [Mycolicibacterium palauense]|uniref:DUF732 domain-containing protein n=1 Tax=Mycolicibacterium palauense TaxID=2034511 RepID=UPI001FE74B4D|nr:DUF732 domain-containing protein [Mycolicibacterium palauense]